MVAPFQNHLHSRSRFNVINPFALGPERGERVFIDLHGAEIMRARCTENLDCERFEIQLARDRSSVDRSRQALCVDSSLF